MIILLQVVLGLIILGILVLVHELGHFCAAKAFHIRVLAFSIGFGKPLFKKTIGETEYRISAVPFGGYVHMSGEHPEEKPDVEPGDFTAKPIWQRAVVAIAGPLANFVFAMICLYAVFILGVNTPQYLSRPVIGGVADSSIAAQAGFLPGDSIVSLNSTKVSSWEAVEHLLAFQQPVYEFSIIRDGAAKTLRLVFGKTKSSRLPKEPTGGLQPSLPAIIGAVNPGSPAEKAGLQNNDTVVSINAVLVHSWYQLSTIISRYDSTKGPLSFIVKRGSIEVSASVVPKFGADAKRFLVGIAMGQPQMRKVQYGPLESVVKMMDKTGEYTVMIFDVLSKLLSHEVSPKQLAGPVGIVQMSGVVALSGLVPILDFMALIGINLGVLNLMPLIITDGGLLLFLLIEFVRKKPLPVKYQSLINKIAILFFVSLFFYVTLNDIGRIPDLIRMFGK